jgi:hypothetical protein
LAVHFADQRLVKSHQLSQSDLELLFNNNQYQQKILAAIKLNTTRPMVEVNLVEKLASGAVAGVVGTTM